MNARETARRQNSKRRQEGNGKLNDLKKEMPKIIDPSKDPDGKELVKSAREMAEICKGKGMTTSQVRHLFQEVQNIAVADDFLYKVSRLRYKFAYTAGRHKQVKPLQEVAEEALKNINNKDQLGRFRDFFEAVVAYHRYLGGKE